MPPNIFSLMERFGKFEWDPQNSSENATTIWSETQEPLLDFATNDPTGFVAALADEVSPLGGWPAYGAGRTVINLLAGAGKGIPRVTEILDAEIGFLRQSGVPPMRVAGYEWDRWIDSGGTNETWLTRLSEPTAESAPVRELAAGEVRRVAQLFAEPESNVVLVCPREGGYAAIIDARWSDEDPRRVQNEWKSADSLFALYLQIGLSLQTPPFWCDPELRPYFPLPEPTI